VIPSPLTSRPRLPFRAAGEARAFLAIVVGGASLRRARTADVRYLRPRLSAGNGSRFGEVVAQEQRTPEELHFSRCDSTLLHSPARAGRHSFPPTSARPASLFPLSGRFAAQMSCWPRRNADERAPCRRTSQKFGHISFLTMAAAAERGTSAERDSFEEEKAFSAIPTTRMIVRSSAAALRGRLSLSLSGRRRRHPLPRPPYSSPMTAATTTWAPASETHFRAKESLSQRHIRRGNTSMAASHRRRPSCLPQTTALRTIARRKARQREREGIEQILGSLRRRHGRGRRRSFVVHPRLSSPHLWRRSQEWRQSILQRPTR